MQLLITAVHACRISHCQTTAKLLHSMLRLLYCTQSTITNVSPVGNTAAGWQGLVADARICTKPLI